VQLFELLLGFAQFQPKPTNAKAGEDRLDLVSDPRLLGDEARSRFGRLASSSSIVGIATMLQ
jgi:hypothetical protein